MLEFSKKGYKNFREEKNIVKTLGFLNFRMTIFPCRSSLYKIFFVRVERVVLKSSC